MNKKHTPLNCILIVSLLILTLIYSSCQNSSSVRYSAEERKTADSLIHANRDSASLYNLLSIYSENDYPLIQIGVYRELGRLYRNKSQFLEAIDAHKKGLAIALEVKDTLEIIQAYNN